MTGDDPVARRLLIHGRVQGVGYRAWMSMQARSLGIAGWVRNRLDGTVEAVVGGPAGAVDELIRRCWIGPASATVEAVEAQPEPVQPTGGFRHLPTA